MRKPFALCLLIVSGFSLPTQSAEPVPDVSAQDPNCACVAQGKRWGQGEEACISGISMVCGMNQNISTWKSLGTSCQTSSLFRAQANFTPM
jgi:hypothetical protein